MIVTMVSIDALPLMVGLSLMLGANLGSSLLPLWVTRAMPPLARQGPLMNFLIRGSVSIIMLIAINRSQIIEFLPNLNDAQKVIFCHILFNLLLLLAVPADADTGTAAASTAVYHCCLGCGSALCTAAVPAAAAVQ